MYFNNEVYVYVCLYIWMCIFIFICTCILMICMKQMYKLFIFFSLLFCYQSVIFDLIAVGGGGGLVLHAKMRLGGRDHYNCCIEYGVLNVL